MRLSLIVIPNSGCPVLSAYVRRVDYRFAGGVFQKAAFRLAKGDLLTAKRRHIV